MLYRIGPYLLYKIFHFCKRMEEYGVSSVYKEGRKGVGYHHIERDLASY